MMDTFWLEGIRESVGLLLDNENKDESETNDTNAPEGNDANGVNVQN